VSSTYRIKYRPNGFTQFIGLKPILPTIESIVRRKRIAPVIISGNNGSGKSTLLEILGRRLACTAPIGLDPCNACEACRSLDIRRGGVDVFAYSGIELSRNLISSLKRDLDFYPMINSIHTVIIDDLDHGQSSMLNHLIRLMEINEEMLFLFTATRLKNIPNPLLQRCMRISLDNYAPESLKAFVRHISELEGIDLFSETALEDLIELSDRNPRSILNALEAIKDNGLSISQSALDNQNVRDNLGGDVYE